MQNLPTPLAPGGQELMYTDLAWAWALISPPAEYVREANDFARLIRRYGARRPRPRSLLDLGCGGGHNDFTLKKHFQVTGIDLSPQMLAQARQLNPEVAYFNGDLRQVRLEQTFDAVICADSIDYMLDEADLKAAFQTAHAHLGPGGVFVTYAEATPERFEQNRSHAHTCRTPEVEITLLRSDFDPDPQDTTYEMTFVYLLRRASHAWQLETYVDRHLAGIFPLSTWQRLLQETGFQVHLSESAYGEPIFVGCKP